VAFAKFEEPEIIAKTLGCIIERVELVGAFLKSGGLKVISELLKSPNPEVVIAALPLVRIAAGGSPPDKAKGLVSELLAARQWDCALDLIENCNINAKTVVGPILSQILIASDSSDRSCQLALLVAKIEQLQISQITPRLAIVAKNATFVEKLMECDRLVSTLNEAAVSAVIDDLSGDAETRLCAARICSMMPMALIEGLMEFINKLDFDNMCQILLPLSQGRNAAEVVLRHVDCLQKKVGTERAPKIFAEIAGFFSTECLEISWLIESLSKSLSGLELVEPSLKVLLRLADSPQLHSNAQLVKRLTKMITSSECSPNEMCILMAIFAKLSPNCVLTDTYPHLLQAAEARMDYSVHALGVLAGQRVRVPTTRYARGC
jgi:hypothetical protein